MKRDEMFPSKYLRAEDLRGQTIVVTVAGVEWEEVGDSETHPVVHFENKKKGMVLRPTNGDMLFALLGEDSDDWTGKQVELYVTDTVYKGRPTKGVRVRGIQAQTPAGPPEDPDW